MNNDMKIHKKKESKKKMEKINTFLINDQAMFYFAKSVLQQF